MTAFLRDFIDNIRENFYGQNPFKVLEVKTDDYIKYEVIGREECLMLYDIKDMLRFEILLHIDITKAVDVSYSLIRTMDRVEAETTFIKLKDKLPILIECIPHLAKDKDYLQEVISIIREKDGWNLAHIVCHLGLSNCLRHQAVTSLINEPCPHTMVTCLHVAVKKQHLPVIQELMELDVRLDIADNNKDTAFHFAAKTNKDIIQALSLKEPVGIINFINKDGYAPLHLACLADKPDCVKELLRSGANVNIASVHDDACLGINRRSSSVTCAKDIIDMYPTQLHVQDMKLGGTPLHWAKSTQVLELLIELGCNINAKNFQGDTALHIMVARNRISCVLCLLSHGASVDIKGADGNTPLHLAVKAGNLSLVHAFIVFGANVDSQNNRQESPRHIAATDKKGPMKEIVYALHSVGASRCTKQYPSCNDFCIPDGSSNGIIPEKENIFRTPRFCEELIGISAVMSALNKKRKASDSPERTTDLCRVLCLDGGGIRGLVLIQVLGYIEKLAQMDIIDCFDWIAGTSTGGVLALAMCTGKSVAECRCLYFRLKDKVFVGNRPYDAELLEKFLQTELGSDNVMADIKRPRVMVTGVLADRHPADLHLFRSYDSPKTILAKEVPSVTEEKSQYSEPEKPSKQLIWRAARASGAAPTYFRASGCFLDGGLISNNPTLDALTEIHQYNVAVEAAKQEHLKQKITTVISVGTGKMPTVRVSTIDLFRPDSLLGAAKIAMGASALGQLLVDQATQTDGQVVERAHAWCSMIDVPYFRINPPLSENINLDETDDTILLRTLWEVDAYMHFKKNEIMKIVRILKP